MHHIYTGTWTVRFIALLSCCAENIINIVISHIGDLFHPNFRNVFMKYVVDIILRYRQTDGQLTILTLRCVLKDPKVSLKTRKTLLNIQTNILNMPVTSDPATAECDSVLSG